MNRLSSAPSSIQQPTVKQRVFTGTVTKLHENFGFVDDDVIFQASSVKGAIPQVGDRVLVEASYNGSMPFKWSAQRVQVIAPQAQKHLSSFSSSNGKPIWGLFFLWRSLTLLVYRHWKTIPAAS